LALQALTLGWRGNAGDQPTQLQPMPPAARAPGLIQRYREALQVRHYAGRTVNTYKR
jgi:hypothetical protein